MDTWHFTSHPRRALCPTPTPALAFTTLVKGFLSGIQLYGCIFLLFQSHQKYFPSASLQAESPVAMGTCQTRYFPRVMSSQQKSVKDERSVCGGAQTSELQA